jgi:hypothetical protein
MSHVSRTTHSATAVIGRYVDHLTELVRKPGAKYVEGAPVLSMANSSVRPWIVTLATLPLVLLTPITSMWQLRTTALILCNVWVRLVWPSCYFPATASTSHVIASPFTARMIAFVAEFHFYEVVAIWYKVDFWGSYIWLIVLVGELISTSGVLLQSELLLFIEDCMWTLHGVAMAYVALPAYALLLWSGFLSFVHLPRRYRLFRQRPVGNRAAMICPPRASIRQCDEEEISWVVPMLLGQPLLTALCYAYINRN